MPSLSAKPQGRQQPEGKGYEKRDANARWIFGIIGFLLVAGLVVHFCLAAVMRRMEKKPPTTDPWTGTRRETGPIAENKSIPHLQLTPAEDLKQFRAREDGELKSYGWINRTAGVVRIPIDRAMESLLQRGLPARSETNVGTLGASSHQLQQERPSFPQPEIQETK
jgi:hypothetical protein